MLLLLRPWSIITAVSTFTSSSFPPPIRAHTVEHLIGILKYTKHIKKTVHWKVLKLQWNGSCPKSTSDHRAGHSLCLSHSTLYCRSLILTLWKLRSNGKTIKVSTGVSFLKRRRNRCLNYLLLEAAISAPTRSQSSIWCTLLLYRPSHIVLAVGPHTTVPSFTRIDWRS